MSAAADERGAGGSGRFARQVALPQWSERSQQMLRHASVSIVGCGALGCGVADALVRAGVGHLQLIDRDVVQVENLHRQVLFDEQDAAASLPKAEAAARRLRRIHSGAEVTARVTHLGPANAEGLLRDADLLVDGADNLETRYLLNDLAVKFGMPWVYGGAIGVEGRVLPVVPGRTPCLRCIWPDPPAAGALPTCETAGVLGTLTQIVASFQATLALKLLSERFEPADQRLLTVDVWRARVRGLDVRGARAEDCRCCRQRRFEFLQGERGTVAAHLCGREAVQILPPAGIEVTLERVAAGLNTSHRARRSEHLLRFWVGSVEVLLFPDGRALLHGTNDAQAARSLYDRFVGT